MLALGTVCTVLSGLASVVFAQILASSLRDADWGRWACANLVLSIVSLPAAESTLKSVFARWGTQGEPVPPRRVREVEFGAMLDPSSGEPALDLSLPCLLRGALAGTASAGWDIAWLAASPRGDVLVDYFADGRRTAAEGGLVPDARASFREIVSRLQSGAPVKSGSELLFRKFPELLRELPLDKLHSLFGAGHFEPSRVGSTLTAPLFISRGVLATTTTSPRANTTTAAAARNVRTDLHCEPIANVALHLVGAKRWTLVAPEHSRSLRPRISRDGRGYIFADLDPDDNALQSVERYEVRARHGDALYVPSFWWHRVDYEPGEISMTASLFHFRLGQILLDKQSSLFFAALLPNLVKELIGWKTQ